MNKRFEAVRAARTALAEQSNVLSPINPKQALWAKT